MEKHVLLNSKNFYRTYFIDQQTRPTIVIFPGGGYKYTSPREAEPVVHAFMKHGFHAVVVFYRETLDLYPMPGKCAAETFVQLKQDPRVGKTIGLGFSAGGHCVLEYCLHYKEYQGILPDLLMLGYPVVSSDLTIAHHGSFDVLLGEQNKGIRDFVSLENQVTKETAVDLFLWGTYTDSSVPVENSWRLLDAYRKVGGSVEYHMFYFGKHGLSVANQETCNGDPDLISPYIGKWIDLAVDWIHHKLNQKKI